MRWIKNFKPLVSALLHSCIRDEFGHRLSETCYLKEIQGGELEPLLFSSMWPKLGVAGSSFIKIEVFTFFWRGNWTCHKNLPWFPWISLLLQKRWRILIKKQLPMNICRLTGGRGPFCFCLSNKMLGLCLPLEILWDSSGNPFMACTFEVDITC